MPDTTLLLGIDGGGTKTVAWLGTWPPETGEADPTVIGRGLAGPSNPQSVGWAVAVEQLEAAVAACFADAGHPRQPAASAVVCLAGSDRRSVADRLVAWGRQVALADHLRCVHDAEPLLAMLDPPAWGVSLIAGTGSLAYGRDRSGRSARAGGWGFLFGDEGSGFWLGAAALRAALRATDRRGPATSLAEALCARCRVGQPEALIGPIYGAEDPRRMIASLADVVTAEARRGDAVARTIVQQAAGALAEMVQVVAERLDLADGPFPLAWAGGVLLRTDAVATPLIGRLEQRGLNVERIVRVPEPVRGALRLAAAEGRRRRP